jgi:plasmid stabilization system protein ParE
VGLSVFWTQFAKDKLDDIFEYHRRKANVKVARNLVSSIVDHTSGLENQPHIGQLEEC